MKSEFQVVRIAFDDSSSTFSSADVAVDSASSTTTATTSQRRGWWVRFSTTSSPSSSSSPAPTTDVGVSHNRTTVINKTFEVKDRFDVVPTTKSLTTEAVTFEVDSNADRRPGAKYEDETFTTGINTIKLFLAQLLSNIS